MKVVGYLEELDELTEELVIFTDQKSSIKLLHDYYNLSELFIIKNRYKKLYHNQKYFPRMSPYRISNPIGHNLSGLICLSENIFNLIITKNNNPFLINPSVNNIDTKTTIVHTTKSGKVYIPNRANVYPILLF